MKTSVILSRALFVLFAVLCLTAAPFQGAAQENEPDESAVIMEMISIHKKKQIIRHRERYGL